MGLVGSAVLQAIDYANLRCFYLVAEKLQPGAVLVHVRGEYVLEHFLEALVLALVRRQVRLEKIVKGLGLDLDKIRNVKRVMKTAKADTITHCVLVPVFCTIFSGIPAGHAASAGICRAQQQRRPACSPSGQLHDTPNTTAERYAKSKRRLTAQATKWPSIYAERLYQTENHSQIIRS